MQEKARSESGKDRFETIFFASDVAQKIIDHNLNILEINNALIDLLGYTREEITGTKILDYTHPDFREKWHQLQLAIWENKLPNFQLEACLIKKDGCQIWCIIHTILFENDNRMFGYTMLEDITSRKQLERHKDEFVSTVAHELRTPLTAIKSQCQLLERKMDGDHNNKQGLMIDSINKNVNRLTRLIDNLIMVSRIEAGIMKSAVEPYDIVSLVIEVTDECRLIHSDREFYIKGEKKMLTMGDEDKIRQVLYNLLSNAVKFSGADTTISVSVAKEKEAAIICIEDHGRGIPKESLDAIFGRFYQVETHLSRMQAGMGLGLYISSEIIKQQNGKLWVNSLDGKGTTFCFSLPLID